MNRNMMFERREVLRTSLILGGLVGLQGCATPSAGGGVSTAGGRAGAASGRPRLTPMRVGPGEIVDIKCCLRPFRAFGPRLDAEQIGDTLVIHNYGHGGSGWSLSWGSAEVAVGKAMSVLPAEIAVVGCGIVGLTAAIQAQRAGAKVTIYAREMFPRTRSVRANGSWTPDSRIALTAPAGPAFGDLWERMARFSWKSFRSYLGLPERPVEFSDQYRLSDTPPEPRHEGLDPAKGSFATTGQPQQAAEFADYSDRIRDIIPQGVILSEADNPFPTRYARRASSMHFNFASYGKLLLSEFFAAGGRFENRDFHSPADVASVREKVVINCPGYAARDLWRDKSIIPVRGQTGWLMPQIDAPYGVYYKGISLLSKSDGVMVQNLIDHGLGDMMGVGDSMELPDRAETEQGLALVAPLFARMRAEQA